MVHRFAAIVAVIVCFVPTHGLKATVKELKVKAGRTIGSPRVFRRAARAADDDKGDSPQDFGITMAFDFSLSTLSLVAVNKDVSGTTRLLIFDLEQGTVRAQPTISSNPRAQIKAVKLSPDGKFAAVPTGQDNQITLWSVESGGRIDAKPTDGEADDVDWHPSGELLAVVGGKNIEIWKIAGGVLERQRFVRGARAATEWPMSARWSPDAAYLAIGTNSPAVYIGKADGSAQSASLSKLPKGAVYMTEWNPSGDRLAAAGFGSNGEVSIWKDPKMALDSPFERKYELLRTFTPPASQWWSKLTWDPSGQFIAMGDNKSNLGIWEASSGTVLQTFVAHPNSAVLEVHWKEDVLISIGAFPDKNFRIWNVTQ